MLKRFERMKMLGLVLVALFWTACGTDSARPAAENNPQECTDECTLGDRACLSDTQLQTCRRGADGCFEFREVTCLESEICEDADCVNRPRDCEDTCTPPDNRCTSEGETESCSDHNRDGCFEFGGAEFCGTSEICDPADGLCKPADCDDLCTQGDTICRDGLLSTCGPGPGDCLIYLGGKECPDGEQCQVDACVPGGECQDECDGENLCAVDGGVRTCEDSDNDGCTELSDSMPCPGGESCRSGTCVSDSTCRDLCVTGEAVCVGNEIARCETQSDGCLAFAAATPCPNTGESCVRDTSGTSCRPGPTSGAVVINEVFYDAIGDDYRSGASSTFIEIAGPPALSLAGYTIDLINGSTASSYNRFTLPSNARLDGNGYAVLAMTDADSYLVNDAPGNIYYVLTGYSTNQDAIQNGPDNVVLEDGTGTVIDALAYGTFATNDPGFAGEGSAVAAPVPGRSVGRIGGSDTDDNAADFVSLYPTPGAPNSDLLINEIYFDQGGQDGVQGSTETFVELTAPVRGWEDLPLDGYILRAINGFDDMDYIFSVDSMGNPTVNGIEMSTIGLNDGSNDGLVVVCNIDLASAALLSSCTVPYEGSDFQNGPDYFVLEYEGRVIDAIAYGNFSSTPAFGEGNPATFTGSFSGKAFGRWPSSDPSRPKDTDDNASDFYEMSPSPGQENPLPANP